MLTIKFLVNDFKRCGVSKGGGHTIGLTRDIGYY